MKRSPFREAFRWGFEIGIKTFPKNLISLISPKSYDKYSKSMDKNAGNCKENFITIEKLLILQRILVLVPQWHLM